MKYKMLVVDLDDTLLNDELNISDKDKNAILKAKEKGVVVVFCSGRADKSILQQIKKLDLHDENEYYISYNGAKIDNLKGETIFKKYIEGDLLQKLIEVGRNRAVDIQLYQEYMVVEKITERTIEYEEMAKVRGEKVESLNSIEYTTKILYNFNDINKLQALEEEINKLYKNEVNVFFSKPTFLEVLHKQANKGLAMTYLANHLGIEVKEVIAVGDSFNDISMIEAAGLGVAVQNGRNEVKEKADYVTKSTNNESAIAEIINLFIK